MVNICYPYALQTYAVLPSLTTVLHYLRMEGKFPGLMMKKFQAFQDRYEPCLPQLTEQCPHDILQRCYRIVSSPGLICLMVNSLMRWWLCSLRVQCSETQSDWNNRSYNNIHPKLVQIHIFSLHYYRTPFRQSQKQHTGMVIYKKTTCNKEIKLQTRFQDF